MTKDKKRYAHFIFMETEEEAKAYSGESRQLERQVFQLSADSKEEALEELKEVYKNQGFKTFPWRTALSLGQPYIHEFIHEDGTQTELYIVAVDKCVFPTRDEVTSVLSDICYKELIHAAREGRMTGFLADVISKSCEVFKEKGYDVSFEQILEMMGSACEGNKSK